MKLSSVPGSDESWWPGHWWGGDPGAILSHAETWSHAIRLPTSLHRVIYTTQLHTGINVLIISNQYQTKVVWGLMLDRTWYEALRKSNIVGLWRWYQELLSTDNSDEEKMFYHHWSVRAECVECECVCFYSMNIHYFRPVWSLDVAEMKMRVLEDLRIHTSTLHRMHFSSKLKSMRYEASMEDVRLCRVIMSKWHFMSSLRYDRLDQNMSCACQL